MFEVKQLCSGHRCSRISPKFVVLLCLWLFSVRAVAQEQRLSQYSHRAWPVRDGFVASAANAITQTVDGYIWIGTDSGLFRFDGSHFELWPSPDGKKLPSNLIRALVGAHDGSLWIGMVGGIAHFADHRLFVYPDFHDDVGGLLEDKSGNIWLTRGDAGGTPQVPLCQALPERIHCLDESDGFTTRVCCAGGLAQDTEGYLWIITEGPVLRWKSGSVKAYVPDEGTRTKGISTASQVIAMPDGSVLVSLLQPGPVGGVQKFSGGSWKPLRVPGFDGAKIDVLSLFRDSNGGIWVGTLRDGIYRVHENEFERFGSEDGLTGNLVRGLYQDRENGIWVATSGGVDYFHPRKITTFSKREGLSSDSVLGVAIGPTDVVWLNNNDSLVSLRDGRVETKRPGHGLPGVIPTAIFEDSSGRLWSGVDHDLYRYEQGEFHKVSGLPGSSNRYIVGIAEDSAHDIWAEVSGETHELVRVRGLRVIEEYPEAIIPSARALAGGPDGLLWLGLRNGDLARFHNGQAEVFPSPGGPKSYVDQVVVNADGTVFATTSAGLIGWKDGTSRLLSSKNGLPCDSVVGLAWDNRDSLWLDTACGLANISKDELNRWWRDDTSVVAPKILDFFDGVQSGRPNFNPMARSSDGRLWIANSYSLQVLDLAHISQNNLRPPVQIEKLVVDRKPYDPINTLTFPPLMLDLEIDYGALSFINPQKVKFRYKLEGRDTAWQEAGNRRQAFYTDLPPRSYRFRVMASNDDGVWNEEGASVVFSIAPAWYQTTVFRISCVFVTFLGLWLIYYLRMEQASHSIRTRFEERTAERTRLARDLHDTLLQTLQGSKLVADDALENRTDPDHMRRSLEKLAGWIDRAMREGRAALNALYAGTLDNRELSERLQSALEEFQLNSVCEKSLTISGASVQMDPIIKDEICKIGYEAIRNALVHACATRIEVQLAYAEDFTLIVRDNGRGIDSTVATKGRDGHYGLQSMRERAGRINGSFQLITAPSLGTTIELKLPGKTAFGGEATTWSKLQSWLRGRRSEA